MNLFFIAAYLILSLFTSTAINAQSADSSRHVISVPAPVLIEQAKDELQYIHDDDFSPGMGILAFVAFLIVLACVGVGIAFTIIGLFILFGLISIGVLSTSIMLGIHQKSFAKGFKMFLVSMSAIVGVFIFSFLFWALNVVTHWFAGYIAISIGATMGLLIGLLFGWLVFFVLQKFSTYLKQLLTAR